MITIKQRIDVSSPPDAVWKVLAEPEDVLSCIAGAELGERHEDGSFDAALAVRFGGLRVAFTATATLELLEGEMEGRLTARGSDRQGATRVRSETVFRVQEGSHGGTSLVTIDGEVTLSGKLAPVIDAGAGVVVTRMTREFAEALAQRCAPEVAVDAAVPQDALPTAAAPAVSLARPKLLVRLRAWLARIARPSLNQGGR